MAARLPTEHEFRSSLRATSSSELRLRVHGAPVPPDQRRKGGQIETRPTANVLPRDLRELQLFPPSSSFARHALLVSLSTTSFQARSRRSTVRHRCGGVGRTEKPGICFKVVYFAREGYVHAYLLVLSTRCRCSDLPQTAGSHRALNLPRDSRPRHFSFHISTLRHDFLRGSPISYSAGYF